MVTNSLAVTHASPVLKTDTHEETDNTAYINRIFASFFSLALITSRPTFHINVYSRINGDRHAVSKYRKQRTRSPAIAEKADHTVFV